MELSINYLAKGSNRDNASSKDNYFSTKEISQNKELNTHRQHGDLPVWLLQILNS